MYILYIYIYLNISVSASCILLVRLMTVHWNTAGTLLRLPVSLLLSLLFLLLSLPLAALAALQHALHD